MVPYRKCPRYSVEGRTAYNRNVQVRVHIRGISVRARCQLSTHIPLNLDLGLACADRHRGFKVMRKANAIMPGLGDAFHLKCSHYSYVADRHFLCRLCNWRRTSRTNLDLPRWSAELNTPAVDKPPRAAEAPRAALPRAYLLMSEHRCD